MVLNVLKSTNVALTKMMLVENAYATLAMPYGKMHAEPVHQANLQQMAQPVSVLMMSIISPLKISVSKNVRIHNVGSLTDVFALTTISLIVMVVDNVLLTVKPMLKRLHVFVITPTIFIISVIMLAKHAHQDNSQMLPEQNAFAHKIQSIRMEFVYQIALERRFMLKMEANVSAHLTTFFLEIFVLKGVDLTKNSIVKVKSVIVSLDMLSLVVLVNNVQLEKAL